MSDGIPGLIYLRDDKNTTLELKVKREGITTERNFKISEQEMYSNDSKHHSTNFYDNGDDGLTFKCTILFVNDVSYGANIGKLTGGDNIEYTDNNTGVSNTEYNRYANDINTLTVLDTWYLEKHVFNLTFDKLIALRLPLVSKKWIVSKMTMKQESDTMAEWDVTFRTYNPPKQITVIKNKLVNRTSKSWKWQNNCKKAYKNLNYKDQKKKKWPKSDCCKILNGIMVELGFLDKEEKSVKTKKKKKGKPVYKTTSYVPDTWVHNDSIDKALKKATKASKKTSSSAIKTFKKEWNKYKLKPVLKANKKGKYEDTIDKDTFKAIGNYAELKSAKKKK